MSDEHVYYVIQNARGERWKMLHFGGQFQHWAHCTRYNGGKPVGDLAEAKLRDPTARVVRVRIVRKEKLDE